MVEALAIILAAVALAAAVGLIVMITKLSTARSEVDSSKKACAEWDRQFSALRNEYVLQVSKREAIVLGLKQEIQKLEGELDAIQDPAVIRARLRRVLGSFPAPGGKPF